MKKGIKMLVGPRKVGQTTIFKRLMLHINPNQDLVDFISLGQNAQLNQGETIDKLIK